MRFDTLACDYDGTLAANGVVTPQTLLTLQRWKNKGGKLLLVTGRELEDLRTIFNHTSLFERIIAENGAILFNPASGALRMLVKHAPQNLIDCLRRRNVNPLSIGHSILATREPHQTTVLEAIHELGLEYHIIFNKGAVMILPSTVTKATGLKAALKELGWSADRVAGIGDAENDHAFLQRCGLSVAVANALPALKKDVDLVTRASDGAGVVELIERLLEDNVSPPQGTMQPVSELRREREVVP